MVQKPTSLPNGWRERTFNGAHPVGLRTEVHRDAEVVAQALLLLQNVQQVELRQRHFHASAVRVALLGVVLHASMDLR